MIYHTKVKKAGIVIPIDWDKLPPVSQERAKAYGLVQLVGDSLSAFSLDGSKTTTKTTPEDMAKMANEYVEALYRGEIKKTRSSMDSVTKMAFTLATRLVVNKWVKANPGKDVKDYANRQADANAELVANNEKWMAKAQEIVDITSGEDVE